MTLATLADVLQPALREGYAVAGLVCLGWEDMQAYVEAAAHEHLPVILQAGPGCRAHTPLPVLAAMMRHLAESVDVPIVVHLDHGYTEEECRIAIDCGFTSIMYDGSSKELARNIDETAAIASMARAAGISCEGEIGFVGYADGRQSLGTDPEEAAQFARATGIDAMAISVGNVHLQTKAGQGLDEDRIRAIEQLSDVPLVIHGGSGVPIIQRQRLAQYTAICKFNIGTELRQAFGHALRRVLAGDAEMFDRISILEATRAPMVACTRGIVRNLSPEG